MFRRRLTLPNVRCVNPKCGGTPHLQAIMRESTPLPPHALHVAPVSPPASASALSASTWPPLAAALTGVSPEEEHWCKRYSRPTSPPCVSVNMCEYDFYDCA